MFLNIFYKLFGSQNDRIIKKTMKTIQHINMLEKEISELSDEELKNQTVKLKNKLKETSLEEVLPEAFATVREAAKRVLGQRHYDVQLIGGIILHQGMISEMKTGEGKTLVATLPSYLNALTGEGVHIVTVNDYLAKRDAEWMGRIHNFLGLSVGCIYSGLNDDERKQAYNADITYGTNNEFGFDYLRDNMKFSEDTMVQRKLKYAIVDEVDSILIDEARTPLIISGPTNDNSELYIKVDALIPHLKIDHYEIDEKARNVLLTEEGNIFAEEWLNEKGLMQGGLYDIVNISVLHHVTQALKAHKIFSKDVDYIVKAGQILIIDEFTGRVMDGRRYSEGLHQAIEAKENVQIKNENQTLASITYQNYFRQYEKLAGMTGTADTEAAEFREIYRLHTVVIPTHKPMQRIDEDDEVYRTAKEKYGAILKLIKERHQEGQPILVGTVSIEKSELISGLLEKEKIKHQVLNAKYHEQEAEIIAQAGKKGGVTIATNMAGRGTDIMLGGNLSIMIKNAIKGISEVDKINDITIKVENEYEQEKQAVLALGGLLVIGTERHESRRIDNQLRGRSGRQGDPGKTKFFLSLEDDLMRIFGSDRISETMKRLGMEEGTAISHPWVTKALQKAQFKVEARNYDIRKNLLKFDDVMNEQRSIIYGQRRYVMSVTDIYDIIEQMLKENISALIAKFASPNNLVTEWEVETIQMEILRIFGNHIDIKQILADNDGISSEQLDQILKEQIIAFYKEKESHFGGEVMRFAEKRFLILSLDLLWKDHLLSLDHLRHGINLRAYGQKDPLIEYKKEAFALFEVMLDHLREIVIERICHMEITIQDKGGNVSNKMHGATHNQQHGTHNMQSLITTPQVGRNEPCPCGSGKKYKYCCGKVG